MPLPRGEAMSLPSIPRHHRHGAAPFRAALFLAAVTPSLLPAHVAAQGASAAALRGRVTDAAGAPLPDTEIRVTRTATGAVTRLFTDADGRYYVVGLAPGGPYVLEAVRIGYATAREEGILLSIGENRRIDLRLGERAVEVEGITVSGRADPVFGTVRMGTSTAVAAEEIRAFPTVRRELLELADLSPLVQRRGDRVSISGLNDRANAVQLDGTPLQDLFGAGEGGLPGARARARAVPLEALQEYQVLVSPFDVRQAGFSGGLIHGVTRSGTNRWEGTLWGYARNEALLGELRVEGAPIPADSFRRQSLGFSLGGPLAADRTHLFVAGELERGRTPPDGFSVGVVDPALTRVDAATLSEISGILRDVHGIDAGTFDASTLENPVTNLLLRGDHRFSEIHTLTLQANLARASNELSPRRQPVGAYEFASSGIRAEHDALTLSGRLLSRLGSRWSNDLQVSLRSVRDQDLPRSDAPLVELFAVTSVEGRQYQRQVRAGGEYFAHDQRLDQRVFHLENALVGAREGTRLTTVGASLRQVSVDYRSNPGSRGVWSFPDIESLASNAPIAYEVRTLAPGAEPAVSLAMTQVGAFVQNEWTVEDDERPGEVLTLRLGLRVERPFFSGGPARNRELEESFGRFGIDLRTDRLPTQVALSPRFGFNWASRPEGRQTRLRGGVGLFSGPPPLVWMAGAMVNDGNRVTVLTCRNTATAVTAPPLTTGPAPATCLEAAGTTRTGSGIDTFDPAFRFPREWKATVGVDQELPFGLTATLEGLVSYSVNQPFAEDLNLPDSTPVGSRPGFPRGVGPRPQYGEPGEAGYAPRREDDRFSQVIRWRNEGENVALGIVTELRGTLLDRVRWHLGYAYSRAFDTQSLEGPDGITNFGRTPIRDDPNRPPRRPSAFDRPQKLVLSAAAPLQRRLGETVLSVFFTRESGNPYSYVYGLDVNGDGYPGTGAAREAWNDLLYVPLNLVESGEFPPNLTLASRGLLAQLIDLEPCLREARGTILERNACRTPDTERLDLKLSQRLPVGGRTLEISLDLLNALNLLDSSRGLVFRTPAVIPILEEFPGEAGPVLYYMGPVLSEPTGTGGVRTRVLSPLSVVPEESRWQAQLGVRVVF